MWHSQLTGKKGYLEVTMVTRAVQFFVSYIVSDGSSAQGDKETEGVLPKETPFR